MANVKFSRKEIEKSIKLTPEMLDKIMLSGVPVESLDQDYLEIQILPNRPDLISLQGFIRHMTAFIGKEPGLKKYKISPGERDYRVKIDKSVKNIRPYTACAIVKNLKFDDEKIKEIIDIQEKIHSTLGRNRKKIAIGVYPLEKIKLPITYEARDPKDIKFIPLEAKEEMTGIQILNRHPTGREYAHLLQDLDKFPVFVDANKKILSMPPIVNSNETGKITLDTKEVFVECSGFDLTLLNKCLNIIITCLIDLGGKAYSMELEYEKKIITPNFEADKIKISAENASKLIGIKISDKDIEKLLPKMGYDYKNNYAYIPSWRTDILHEVDIIEDLAIAYGYDKITPEIPSLSSIGQQLKDSSINQKISEILIGLGLIETSSYHLIKNEESKIMKTSAIELEDSKTEYKSLRPNLLIPSLRILSENKDNEYPQNIFEIGKTFIHSGLEETGVKEENNLCICLCPSNFTQIKQILDVLIKNLELSYQIKEADIDNLISGRSGKILIDNKPIGYLGEIHPETLRNWNIKMPISCLEISLEKLYSLIN